MYDGVLTLSIPDNIRVIGFVENAKFQKGPLFENLYRQLQMSE